MQRGEMRKRNRRKEESGVKENIVEERKKSGKQSQFEKGCTTVRGRTRSRVEKEEEPYCEPDSMPRLAVGEVAGSK